MTLGRIGYEAYGLDRNWKTFDGREMPRWADLRPDIQKTWNVQGQAIKRFLLAEIHNRLADVG